MLHNYVHLRSSKTEVLWLHGDVGGVNSPGASITGGSGRNPPAAVEVRARDKKKNPAEVHS